MSGWHVEITRPYENGRDVMTIYAVVEHGGRRYHIMPVEYVMVEHEAAARIEPWMMLPRAEAMDLLRALRDAVDRLEPVASVDRTAGENARLLDEVAWLRRIVDRAAGRA